ncbi:MAG: hypothetical protein JXR76_14240, partial [Deltaproteobacteria bacterium]|nr:hypothetical protein [Deltaproteobacteria bacterium]
KTSKPQPSPPLNGSPGTISKISKNNSTFFSIKQAGRKDTVFGKLELDPPGEINGIEILIKEIIISEKMDGLVIDNKLMNNKMNGMLHGNDDRQ